mgnify:CR=1 FL=1
MKMKQDDNSNKRECSVERTLDILGDRWSFLIIREAFFGIQNYDKFQENLGIATNILSQRLKSLVENEIFEKKKDKKDARRSIYQLSPKGLDLYSVTLSIMGWGDRWLSKGKPIPLVLEHKNCGHKLTTKMCCVHCGEQVYPQDILYEGGMLEPNLARNDNKNMS